MNKKLIKGYGNFTLVKQIPINEIKIELIQLKHNILGSEVIKIKNDDDENVFSLLFKTYPKDSTGAAHILEHIVFCGSKKFPVKDPFFSMLKRSLSTFMNAMTGNDCTMYPASTMVEKDFYNILDVYLDAVFHPKLEYMSFLQEAHRLEFAKADDPTSELIYKGIVFNEMKGAMANPDRILHQLMFKYLTPDLPYAFNSGGDPKEIPDLTYENLKEFHNKFYHPSRCLFYFYGNLDLKKQLDFLEEKILKNIEKKPLIPNLPRQKRFAEPKSLESTYPIFESNSLNGKSIISFNYLTCPIENQLDIYALEILDLILMATDASFLKLALLQSKLCTQVESFLYTDMSEAVYSIVCRGCDKKNKTEIFNIIKNTLNKLIEEKIPKKLIESALHQIEFERTEISYDGGPYGLVLFFRSALAKQHGIEPKDSLVIHSLFKKLRKHFEDPDFLANIIYKYFLDNTHLVELTLNPDKNFIANQIQEEKEKLKQIKQNLKPDEIKTILNNTKNLEKYQKSLEETSLECLPKIEINEVPKKNKNYPLDTETLDDFKIFHHETFTNEIVYLDLLFDLPELNLDELFLLPIYSSFISQIGSGKRNYMENLEYIQNYTGGVSCYLGLNIQSNNFNDFIPSIAIKGKALYRNTDRLFLLLKDMITNPIFSDFNRIKELLFQQHSILESSLIENSMGYAKLLSRSSFSYAAKLASSWFGLEYFKKLSKIIQLPDQEISNLIDRFNDLTKKLFCINNAHLVITSCQDMYSDLKKQNFYDLLSLKFKHLPLYIRNFETEKINSHANIIPSSVAFTASSYKTVSYTDKNAAYLLVASYIFENKILHAKIREQGGAYGSSASYVPTTGIFTFTSYRDPHLTSSLNSFKESIKEIANGNFTQKDVNEAILGVIQSIDSPLSPESKGIVAYSWLRSNKTDQMRQEFREKILKSTKKDIIQAVQTILLNQIDKEVTVTFCDKTLLEKEKSNLIIAS